MSKREFFWQWGPIALLVVGSVWCLDFGPIGLYGIGWRAGFRRVKGGG